MLSTILKFGSATVIGASLLLGWMDSAAAQSIIKQPGNHPNYSVELEPHGLVGFDPPGPARDNGLGLGARATFVVLDNGFISKINNSIGIGVGLDWLHYDDDNDDWEYWCRRRDCGWDRGYYDEYDVDYFIVPVVMQWNFWLHRKWSVFGEVGGALAFVEADDWYDDDDVELFPFLFFGGGRFHFSDTAALTMRVGYPYFSLGVSFLL